MLKTEDVVEEMITKYGEWLEMAGDNAPSLLIDILAAQLIKQRELTEYYKRVSYAAK